jgi:hypothetical protein
LVNYSLSSYSNRVLTPQAKKFPCLIYHSNLVQYPLLFPSEDIGRRVLYNWLPKDIITELLLHAHIVTFNSSQHCEPDISNTSVVQVDTFWTWVERKLQTHRVICSTSAVSELPALLHVVISQRTCRITSADSYH